MNKVLCLERWRGGGWSFRGHGINQLLNALLNNRWLSGRSGGSRGPWSSNKLGTSGLPLRLRGKTGSSLTLTKLVNRYHGEFMSGYYQFAWTPLQSLTDKAVFFAFNATIAPNIRRNGRNVSCYWTITYSRENGACQSPCQVNSKTGCCRTCNWVRWPSRTGWKKTSRRVACYAKTTISAKCERR